MRRNIAQQLTSCVSLVLALAIAISAQQTPILDENRTNDVVTPPTSSALPPVTANTEYERTDYHTQKDGDGKKYCLLADFTASLLINYKSKNQTFLHKVDSFDDDTTDVKWDLRCEVEGNASLKVTWNSGSTGSTLNIKFNKDDKSWWAKSVSYSYRKSRKTGFINPLNSKVETVTCLPSDGDHFKTPLGSYHQCKEESPITLKVKDGGSEDDDVSLRLHTLRLQAFQVSDSGKFADSEKHGCDASSGGADDHASDVESAEERETRKKRDTAAVAVGIVLALAVVGMIMGYAGRRYYMERVSYNTMQ